MKVCIVLFISIVIIGMKIDTNAATTTGVFYWWSSSSSGYYGNDGIWDSWYNSTPEQPEHRYDMYSNQISWDGYTEQSRVWEGSVFYASDGNWKRKVVVTYYKTDAVTVSRIELSPSNMTINGLNTSGGRFTVTAFYSDGHSEDVTNSTYWSSNQPSIAWVADISDGTARSLGSTGSAIITAYYPYNQPNEKIAQATVTVVSAPVYIPPVNTTPPDTTPPAIPTFSVTNSDSNGVVIIINYSSDSTTKLYRIGNGQYQSYYGPVTVGSNTTIFAKAQDSSGNWSGESSYTVSYIDRTPPTGSIKINSYYLSPGTLNVTLTIFASDFGSRVSQMMLGNDSNFAGASWEPFITSKNWFLASSGDIKTVYVKFKDEAENISSVYSDTVVVNGIPSIPYVPSTPTVNISSGVYYQMQWISLTAEQGAIIRYTLDGTEPNEYSLIYSNSFIIYNTTTIKAKAYKNGYSSQTFEGVYVIANNQNSTDLLTRARNAYNQGRYSESIELLNILLNSDNRNEPALMLLIDSYIANGDLYGAKIRFRQIVVIYEYPRVVNKYAELCIDRSDSSEAKEVIEEILPKYPNEIYLYRTLARAYGKLYTTGIKVFVYGREVDFTRYDYICPVISDGRTLIPIRALSETMGARVDWNFRLGKANIYLDNKVIEIVNKSIIAKVDGVTFQLDVPARIMGERLMVPLRFISENFGKEVNWFKIGEDASIISVTE